MSFKIRSGINTAVSVTLVLARDDTNPNKYVTEEKLFLPGATVPDNVAPWLIDKYEQGDPHLRSLLEVDEGGVPTRFEPVSESNVETVAPSGDPESAPEAPSYDDWKKAELVAEAEKRGLTVTRSDGQAGEPVVSDYIAALVAFDESQHNPFAT